MRAAGQRILCAMSGGVDSSVAAALLVEAGFEVIGMTMRLYDATGSARRGRGGTCCSPAEIDLARLACERLGIPHYVVDEVERFQTTVIDDFVRAYAGAQTPNPCVRCNEHVKFAPLLARADALGIELLATGHYARAVEGQLHRAADPDKDQSYFLFAMGAHSLRRVVFPLGDWTKVRVREKARELGLPAADARDSQELCFVPDGDHAAVVERRAGALGIDTGALAPGEIRDAHGRVLGQHAGLHRVTIGQRRGLELATGERRYVLRVLPSDGAVVVGDRDELSSHRAKIHDVRWIGADAEELAQSAEVRVQVRHRAAPLPARVRLEGDGALVEFLEPAFAVAPGQAAVIYAGDRVLGGGWIAANTDRHGA